MRTESKTAQVKKQEPKKRPRWAPYLDAQVGVSISGRTFDFDPSSQPHFTSGVVPGLHVDLTAYPLAFLYEPAYGLFAGLGLGLTLDKPFWPDSTTKLDPTQRFPTTELRVEGGLRWRIVLYKPLPRPQLMVQVGGGLHSFGIAKDTMGNDVGPADVGYKYVSIGGGLRIHFAEWAFLYALFHYHAVLDPGPIAADAEYGPAQSVGFRIQGGLDFLVYKGFQLAAVGFFEEFKIGFGFGSMPPQKFAMTATDQYFGGMVTLGYVY
jgi:hypothetical protein